MFNKQVSKNKDMTAIVNLRELIANSKVLYSDTIAFKEINKSREILEYSFNGLYDDVVALGSKLLEMNLKGKHIAILGENSYLWVVSYLAVINGLGVVVPLDKELFEDDLLTLIKNSDCEAIICSEAYIEDVRSIQEKYPKLKTLICKNCQSEHFGFLGIDELIKDGKKLLENNNKDYLNLEIDENKMCQIVFTSGTTGPNKGTMLSQKNIVTVVKGTMGFVKAEGVSFSVLPINHTYESSCHILGGIYSGVTICFNDSLKRVIDNINLFQPNMAVMVPLFLESIYKNIWIESEKQGLTKHLKYGIWFSNLLRKFGVDRRRFFFKPVLGKFGGNLDLIVSGGAPLREEVSKGLTDLGIDILNGFGITECAPLVSCNTRKKNKQGSVGKIMKGCRVRIFEPDSDGVGEIQIKGDNVMLGYYNDPESTKKTFTDDGWFKTGDMGYLDKDGYLFINGREKNLMVLSNGKNVHPEELEDIIIGKFPYIKEVVVYADPNEVGEDTINATVYFDEVYFSENGLELCRSQLREDLKQLNKILPSYKRIVNIFITESEFIKTSTRKIKRDLINEGSHIDA